MFPARLVNWWENVRAALWFIPSLCVLIAFVLTILMPQIDARFAGDLFGHREWLFVGNASAARTILSVISGSLITVVALVFSVTIVALQQASTQFTPRIMSSFTRDPGNQLVLGMYLATFLYALLILRQIRGSDNAVGIFVPILSVTLAIALAVICLGLLVYYIHHATTFFQASSVIEDIHRGLISSIERLHPSAVGEAIDTNGDDLESFRERHPTNQVTVIYATGSGYLRAIEMDRIIASAWDCGCTWVVILPQVGWYVTRGQPLIEFGGISEITPEQHHALENSFVLDVERSLNQDALFAVRQLVDIALKALSPSIHDPTTAEHALSSLGDAIVFLSEREMPSRVRVLQRHDGEQATLILWVNRPSFEDYVDVAFSQIRQTARDNAHVTMYLLTVLDTIIDRCSSNQREPVQRQIDAICWQVERSNFAPKDRQRIDAAVKVARTPTERAHLIEEGVIEEGDYIPSL